MHDLFFMKTGMESYLFDMALNRLKKEEDLE